VKEGQPPRANKPAGVNLLRGNIPQVLDLLNELTFGEKTPPEEFRYEEPQANT